jgi:hypothetical protein
LLGETGNPRIEVGMNLTQVLTDNTFFYTSICGVYYKIKRNDTLETKEARNRRYNLTKWQANDLHVQYSFPYQRGT